MYVIFRKEESHFVENKFPIYVANIRKATVSIWLTEGYPYPQINFSSAENLRSYDARILLHSAFIWVSWCMFRGITSIVTGVSCGILAIIITLSHILALILPLVTWAAQCQPSAPSWGWFSVWLSLMTLFGHQRPCKHCNHILYIIIAIFLTLNRATCCHNKPTSLK